MSHIQNLVDELLAGNNPIIVYADTYAFRQEIKRRGYMETVHLPDGKTADVIRGLNHKFRVNHGNGRITQNQFIYGQSNCTIEDVK